MRILSPTRYVGRVFGNGQCVALVRQIAHLPHIWAWRQGDNVERLATAGKPPPIGTPIATFGSRGHYTNRLDGTSHAAIIAGYTQDSLGIYKGMRVLDQYVGCPARIHTIPFNHAGGRVISNASNYSLIV